MSGSRARVMALLVGVLFAVGTGCGLTDPEPAPPTVMETPRLVWIDGISPSSPLEEDELVKALRAAEVGSAMAWNSGDFTIEQVADHVTRRVMEGELAVYRDAGTSRTYAPGPVPFEPLSITERFEDGGGVVELCRPALGDAWEVGDRRNSAFGMVEPGHGYTTRARVVNEQGKLKYDGDLFPSDDGFVEWRACDVKVPVGLFDPQPVIPQDPQDEPVRPPLFEDR